MGRAVLRRIEIWMVVGLLAGQGAWAQEKKPTISLSDLRGHDAMKSKCAEALTEYEKCIRGKLNGSKNYTAAQEACAGESLILTIGGCGDGKDSCFSPGACTDALGSYEKSKSAYLRACGGNSECNQNLQQCLASAAGGPGAYGRIATANVDRPQTGISNSNLQQLSFGGRGCRDLKTEAKMIENLDDENKVADDDRRAAREKYLDAQENAQKLMEDAQKGLMAQQKELIEMRSGLAKAREAILGADRAFRKRHIQARADLTKAVKETNTARLQLAQQIRGLELQIKNTNDVVQKKIKVASNNRMTQRRSSCTDKYTTGAGDNEYNRYVSAFLDRQRNPFQNQPIATNLQDHLRLSREKQGNYLERVRKVFIQRCIHESINPDEIANIMAEQDVALSESRLAIDGIQAQIKNTQEQIAKLESEIPHDLELVKADAEADVQSVQEDRALAVEQYQQVQQQMLQMQQAIAQEQAFIPQKQQMAQQKVLEAMQNLQLAELRFNQINSALGGQGNARAIVPRGGLAALGEKVEEGLKSFGEMEADEMRAYRACCFNGSPAAAVGGFVDRIFCSQGKVKEATRNQGLRR